MKLRDKQTIAYVLVGVGALFLLLNSGLLGALPSFIWLILLLFLAGAFWFWSVSKLLYWQRLAGFALISIFGISTSGHFAGCAALAFPSLGFGLSYLYDRNRWWAMIPAGLLASLALLLAFGALFPRWDATPILFLGFAGTFTWLYLRCSKGWAIFPAIVFIVLTVLVNDPHGDMPGWFLPLILIGTGLFMLWSWRKESP